MLHSLQALASTAVIERAILLANHVIAGEPAGPLSFARTQDPGPFHRRHRLRLAARRRLWEARLDRFDQYVTQLKEKESGR